MKKLFTASINYFYFKISFISPNNSSFQKSLAKSKFKLIVFIKISIFSSEI
jgi:hypothetical protein